MFMLGTFYILFLETRLYQSSSVTMVKNLNDQMPDLGGLGIFASASSSTVQDARVLETYLSSRDELKRLDRQFLLYEHYHSDTLDFADRLYFRQPQGGYRR
jgi:capsule polysaccharide export protein KpsE/RkpR